MGHAGIWAPVLSSLEWDCLLVPFSALFVRMECVSRMVPFSSVWFSDLKYISIDDPWMLNV